LVKLGQNRQLREIDLSGRIDSLQIRADHYFGISVISLSAEDALTLRDEIEEWLKEQVKISSEPAVVE
jgi:hypothetical protein